MFNYFKDVYYKTNLDYRTGIVDPSQFHLYFFHFMRAFGVIDNEPVPAYSSFLLIFLTLCLLIGVTMSVFSLYHGFDIEDLPFITEAGMYLIIFTAALIIISWSKINPAEYHRLLQTMREDFLNVCTTKSKYREHFFQNQLLTWKVSVWSVILVSSIAVGAVNLATLSLLYYMATHTPGDEGRRPLIFPLWSPVFDFSDSPYYEIAFIVFNIVPCAYAYTYTFNILVEIVWIGEITTKADLIIWSLQDLLDGIHSNDGRKIVDKTLQYRMKYIVTEHESMYRLITDFIAVYKKFLMFTQELFAPVACFTAYAAAEKWEEGEVDVIMILLCISSVILVSIPNYLCTILALKVSSISDACWDIEFWNASHSQLRIYLVLMMQRSSIPLPLRVPGFQGISLEAFSQKLMKAYSLFNMLRQTK